MPTLLMRLEAPMQSYGTFGRFGERDTGKEPGKSAVLGLVCSALGIGRSEDISWLAKFKFGIRADREGIVRNDYHVAGKEGYHRAAGNVERKTAIPTNRYFLADASFLIGLEIDDIQKLSEIEAVLKNPKWQIYLGKKSFVPSCPVWLKDGIKDTPLLQSLKEYKYDLKYLREKPNEDSKIKLRYVVDIDAAEGHEITMVSKVMDVPVSFEQRLFAERQTATLFFDVNAEENNEPQ
ncbi:MAG: type I-E CRISPR-associated protein Cas5/CasD [Candidatus Kapabacteria bacterium]|nr:type I-E CRISPR-associated protein Cas5/CasD [Candidatus Kapabacteria bacterium]